MENSISISESYCFIKKHHMVAVYLFQILMSNFMIVL